MQTQLSQTLPPATIIMTFHAEGVYAHKSLLGFQRIRDYSATRGNKVELICMLDCTEDVTTKMVKNYLYKYGSSKDQIIETSCGNPAAARNLGIEHTLTEYVGILDGDDFLSANWVDEAVRLQTQSPKKILCIPAHILSFGIYTGIQTNVPSREIPKAQMMNMHYWCAHSFARTETYKQNPYNEKVGRQTKFAFEDWDFNLRCISAGIEIEPVAKTYLFYRRRNNSTLSEHQQFNSFTPPSDFFLNIGL